MNTYNYQHMLPTTTMLNTNINGPAMQLKRMWGFAIQAVWTGTPTGTFKIQVSADPFYEGAPGQNPTEPINWTDLIDSPYAVSAAGNYMWNVFDTAFNWARLVYTDGSGGTSTAVLTVSTFNGKGV